MNRTLVAIAVFFGLPTGFGVAMATLRVTGGAGFELAALAGAATAIGLAVGVYLLGIVGTAESADPRRREG